jgi:small GTP-binding protein
MSKVNYKFILIGNSGVGKSSIFKYLSTGEFIEGSIASIGIDKKSLDVSIEVKENNKKFKKDFDISLFDTAGQEQFRSITLSYYKGTDGILLLYDITDRTSFDNIEMWVDGIIDSMGNKAESKYAIILIGNKLDLVQEDESKRKVTEEEAKEICDKYKMIWGGEHSTKTITFDELNKLFGVYVGNVYEIIGEKKVGKQKVKNIKKYKKKSKCIF